MRPMLNSCFCIFLFFASTFSVFANWPVLESVYLDEQKQLEAKVRTNPKNLDYRFDLSMQYAYTGWVEHAWKQLKYIDNTDKTFKQKKLDDLKEQLETSPENWKINFKIAFAYFFNNHKIEALDAMLKAHKLNPDNAFIMGFVGLLYGEQKNYDKSIEWAKRGLKKEPFSTALHFLLAEAFLRKGNYFSFTGESIRVLAAKAGEKKHAPKGP